MKGIEKLLHTFHINNSRGVIINSNFKGPVLEKSSLKRKIKTGSLRLLL